MSGFFPAIGTGGSSTPPAPNDTLEPIGYGADGSLTAITSGASAHNKGSYGTIGTAASAWCGFWLDIGLTTASTLRFLMDISIDGGTSVAVGDLYLSPSTTMNHRIYIPLAVPSGSVVKVRCQGQFASSTFRLAITGRVTSASSPPGFNTCTTLVAADTANTRPPATSVTLQTSLATWTQLLASTSAQYGALLVSVGENAITAAQQAMLAIGTGPAASEAEHARFSGHINTTAGVIPRLNRLIERTIPSGTRISAAAVAAASSTDTVRFGLHGFS